MRNTLFLGLLILLNSHIIGQSGNQLAELHGKLNTNNDSTRIAQLIILGNFHARQDNFDSGKFYYNKALLLSEKINMPRGVVWAKINLGIIENKYGRQKKALDYYFEALAYSEKNNLPKQAADAYTNIANVYTDQKKFEEANNMLLKGLPFQRKINDSVNLLIIYGNLGNNYLQLNKEDSAKKYCDMGLDFCKRIYSSKTPLTSSANLKGVNQYLLRLKAMLHEKKKEFTKALDIYKQLAIEEKDYDGIEEKVTTINKIASVYVSLNDFTKSLNYADTALSLLKKDSIPNSYQEVYEVRSLAFAGLGKFKEAYEAQKLFKQISDSLISEKSLTITNEMQNKYEAEKKDEQILQLNKEKKLQRTITGLAAAAALVALGFLAFAIRSKRLQSKLFKQQQELEKAALEKQMAALEQMALRAQMNPHFIFNSLTSIQHFVYEKDGQAAQKYINSFSRLIRQTLDNSGRQLIPLDDEIKYLDNYLQLEQMRLRNNFQYSITVQETIDQEQTNIPGMLLQPFVENCIKHGIASTQNNEGYIHITISKNGSLSCLIEDNGPGRSFSNLIKTPKDDEYESKGMAITQNRIETINKIYETNITLNIEDLKKENGDPAGTRVKIDFPVDL